MKLFQTSFEHGSYRDKVSNAFGVNTNGIFHKGEKGLAWYNDGTIGNDIALVSSITLSRSAATIEVWFRADAGFGTGDRWLLGYTSGGDSFLGFDATGDLALEGDGGNLWLDYSKTNFVKDTWYHLLSVADGGTVKNYLNGVLIDTTTPGDDVTFQYIGNYSAGNRQFFGYIAKVLFDDEPYTEKQRSKAYERFLNAPLLGSELYPKQMPEFKATDLSNVPNLVAAYNMIPSSGEVLTDISGSGNNGVVNGPIQNLSGLVFDGVGDYIDLNFQNTLTTGDFTFLARVKKNVTGAFQTIFSNRNSASSGYQFRIQNDETISLSIGATALLSTADTPLRNYFDVVFRRSGTDVEIWLDGVNISSGTNANSMANGVNDQIGRRWSTHRLNGEIGDAKIFNRAFTDQEITDYHNQFAKRVVLNRIPSIYDPVGNVPFGMISGTGTYVVDEITTQDSVLKELDIGVL